MKRQSYYAILEISPGATPEEIKNAYRRLAKKYHPDVNIDDPQAEEKFRLATEAYQALTGDYNKGLYESVVNEREIYEQHRREQIFREGIRSQYRHYMKEYSMKTKVMAGIFVVFLIAVVFIGNYFLIKKSSSNLYEMGVEYYRRNDYPSALASLDESIQWLGSRNVQASLLAAEILLQRLGQPELAIEYIQKGLHYNKNKDEALTARLKLLQGISHIQLGNYEAAVEDLQQAINSNPSLDSAHWYLDIAKKRLDAPK